MENPGDQIPPLLWDDLFFEIEEGASQTSALAQQTYKRYWRGVRAIVDSYDAKVGQTPKQEVWRLNKARLYHYTPVKPKEERFATPLLLVYALINRPFIYDLVPGRSFVEFMLEQGFDIYLLDWGEPGLEDHQITFDDYVTEYLRRAVRKMLRLSGAKTFSMMGYCIGATLSTIYAAIYPEAPLKNLVLLTAPIDFSNQPHGSMAVWLDEGALDVDKLVDTLGNVPGELIRQWAKLLKPMENFMGVYINMFKILENREALYGWQAINRWVEDVIPFAGEAFRQFVTVYLRDNQLITGEHQVNGRPVDLANIRASLLNIIAEHDHLVSPSQALSIMDLVSSTDKEAKIIPSTHVGIMISSRAKYKLWPTLAQWLGQRSRV